MVEEKNIVADTTYKTTTVNDGAVAIITQAAALNPNTIEVNINFKLTKYHANNIAIQPGELLFVLKNALKDVGFEINDAGELIVNAPDADNYSIDANGNLIYSYR